MANLIAFSGNKGSGKTTAAKMLVEHGYERLRFAGPMKSMILVLLRRLGYSREEALQRVDGGKKEEEIEELGVTGRHLLQTLGTEWGRQEVKEDLWPTVTLASARQHLDKGVSVVIDDCRFPNEAKMIEGHGGYIIRIIRPELESNTDTHASEQHIDDIEPHATIVNDGSKQELKKKLTDLVTTHTMA